MRVRVRVCERENQLCVWKQIEKEEESLDATYLDTWKDEKDEEDEEEKEEEEDEEEI